MSPRRQSAIRDAALAHPCTACGARPGALCTVPSGHHTSIPHGARFAAAAKAAAETTPKPPEGGTQ